MEILTIESDDHAKFSIGSSESLTVSARLIERTGRWQLNWSAYGDMVPEVGDAYARLISYAAAFCHRKNDAK